jgi:DNA-binding CsgD family transcriptional regulator
MVRLGVVTGRAVHAALWERVLCTYDGLQVASCVTSLAALDIDGDRLDVVVLDLDGGHAAARDAATVTSDHPSVATVVVERGMTLDEIVGRIRTADPSLTVLSSGALQQARGQLRTVTARSPVAAYPRLTIREREVLESLSRGNSTSTIATELRMSVHTCRGHLRTLMAKLGARSQLEVLAFVGEHGLPDT